MKVFLYASLIIIGIVAGVIIRHFHNITVSEEVNLIDMATLVVTVFLAVYIPAVLDQRLQSNKDRQDLLEGRINDYQTLLRRINMLVQSNKQLTEDEYLTIDNLLDVSQHKLRILARLMSSAGMKYSFDRELSEIMRINDEHKELLLSNGTEAGGFTYSVETKNKEEELYNQLEEATSMLILGISNMK